MLRVFVKKNCNYIEFLDFVQLLCPKNVVLTYFKVFDDLSCFSLVQTSYNLLYHSLPIMHMSWFR